MVPIGTCTKSENGFSGIRTVTPAIRTLSLDIKGRLVPADPSHNEKAPDLRALAANNVEIGAARKRTSKENTAYHSVKLDDPSFLPPIYANLVDVEGGRASVALIGSKPQSAVAASAAALHVQNYAQRNARKTPRHPELTRHRCAKCLTPHNQHFAARHKRRSAALLGRRPRRQGRESLSVKLDDPSFPAPLFASLVAIEGGGGYALIWSRRSGD